MNKLAKSKWIMNRASSYFAMAIFIHRSHRGHENHIQHTNGKRNGIWGIHQATTPYQEKGKPRLPVPLSSLSMSLWILLELSLSSLYIKEAILHESHDPITIDAITYIVSLWPIVILIHPLEQRKNNPHAFKSSKANHQHYHEKSVKCDSKESWYPKLNNLTKNLFNNSIIHCYIKSLYHCICWLHLPFIHTHRPLLLVTVETEDHVVA